MSHESGTMTEQTMIAITVAVTSIVTVAITKGIDALIRYRQAEGAMETTTRADLRARILHLEGVVASLQAENSLLHHQLGRMEVQIEMLKGRCDAAELPKPELGK